MLLRIQRLLLRDHVIVVVVVVVVIIVIVIVVIIDVVTYVDDCVEADKQEIEQTEDAAAIRACSSFLEITSSSEDLT